MSFDVFCDELCHQFVPPWPKVGLVDVDGFRDRIEKLAKEDEITTLRSAAFRFFIHSSDHRRPPNVLLTIIYFEHILFEWNYWFVTVIERWLPKTVQFKVEGRAEGPREPQICLITV